MEQVPGRRDAVESDICERQEERDEKILGEGDPMQIDDEIVKLQTQQVVRLYQFHRDNETGGHKQRAEDG